MSKKKKRYTQKRYTPLNQNAHNGSVGYLVSQEAWDTLCSGNYISLDHNPEVMTACHKIAELIGSMTIYLMSNSDKGDIRIINELSRKIDIDPMPTMTRSMWMQSIVMNMLLYGKGNAIVIPHTWEGILRSLEPISASRVSFLPVGYRDYQVLIDGQAKNPENLLHFVYNPDPNYLWQGRGMQVVLRDIANNLKQAATTEKAFMESKWRPSIIVKVDSLIDEFSDPSGRKKLIDDYFSQSEIGAPWLIPAEQFQIEQVRPLSLSDLAIDRTVEINKRTIAAILGVPPFLLGVGEYNKDAWNNFIQNTVRPIALSIQQELTRKLILSPKWYLRFNVLSLMDWDLNTLYTVFGGMFDRGIVTGNEVRDRIGMTPLDGLEELKVLENYIPVSKIGDQGKLRE